MAASAAAIAARAASAAARAWSAASLKLSSDWVVVGPGDPVEPVKSPVDPVPVEPVKSPVEPVPVGPVKSPVEPVPVGPVNSMETGDMVDPVPGDPADGKSEKPVVEGPVNPSSQA